MSLIDNINVLEQAIGDPRMSLPEDVFRFVSRITPIVNVDLLIKDEKGRCLLSWRDDEYSDPGWHVPGGIIRYRETLLERLAKTALSEVGHEVRYSCTPYDINEIFCSHDTRGHFISFLYNCYLGSSFVPENVDINKGDSGYLQWHDGAPVNLIKVHERYRDYINDKECKYIG